MNPNFLQILTSTVQANFSDENFGPEQLAAKLGLSHSTLHRRIKEITGKTISQFIRDIRLEKASELLLNEESTISEIAYKVGFGSVTYFNRCFHEHFGCSPGEYKKKETGKENKSINNNQKTKLAKRWILLLASLMIIIPTLLFLNKKYSFFNNYPLADLSIAVLPVQYLGIPEYEYQAIGLGEEIKNQLSNIEDLRVVDIMSVKEYIADKTEAEIGKELKVRSLLKIIFQKENNKSTLFIKLLNANDGTILFSEKHPKDGPLVSPGNIALTIAEELNAEITPEVKNRIEKVASINPEASDYYQRGENAYTTGDLQNAEEDYRKALEHDPGFARAYEGLAKIAYDKISADDILHKNNIDTVLALVNKAISIDNTLADAYTIKGNYFSITDREKALKQYELAIRYDPNNWQAYSGLGDFYRIYDNQKAMEYYFEAIKRRRGPEYGTMLGSLSFLCTISGLFEHAEKYADLKCEYDEDSVSYYDGLAFIEEYKENFSKAIELANKGYKIDSINTAINDRIAFNLILEGDHKKAFPYYQKMLHLFATPGFKNQNEYHRIGYAFLANGDTLIANQYFHKQIAACKQTLSANENSPTALYDLAATLAILNQHEKAFDYLKTFKSHSSMSWFLYFYMKNDPLLNTIRKEPEFQQILLEVKEKAFTERDKLKTWFEEQENA